MEGAGAALIFALNKLTGLLDQEVSLLYGAKEEIGSLRNNLALLKIFLRVLDEHRDGSEILGELANQLCEVSYDAEDVVDAYLLDVARARRMNSVMKMVRGVSKLTIMHKLAVQTEKIRHRIKEIHENRINYGIELNASSPGGSSQNDKQGWTWRRTRVQEEKVVGFDQPSIEVIRMLIPGYAAGNGDLCVVSMIGMGGLGKTTLAKKIYNNENVKNHFQTRVWTVVSEHNKVKDLLVSILQCLNVTASLQDSENVLQEKLKTVLSLNRFLIVLDDIWTLNFWEEMKRYFASTEKNGSRILLTTRNNDVANAASTADNTFNMEPLGRDDSWAIFCNEALRGEMCPPNLEELGRGIVSKCINLPLAIVVMGSFLAAAEREPSGTKWQAVLEDKSWHVDEKNDCSKILLLSYQNLPRHLKPCFLYVGIFPEDFEIPARQLCLMWVAEGFVEAKGNRLLEDIAEEYLNDLVNRNLITVVQNRSDGGIKTCRIHDLLRELCIAEGEKTNLFKVYKAQESATTKMPRRYSLHAEDEPLSLVHSSCKRLRSLITFRTPTKRRVKSLHQSLPFLRVLNVELGFQPGGWSLLRSKISKMILLRYLSVDVKFRSHFSFQRTPQIGEIWNLQVLDLCCSDEPITLPPGTWNLIHLRHIFIWSGAKFPGAPSASCSMLSLQTLSCILPEKHTSSLITKTRFPNLRRLVLSGRHDMKWLNESLESVPKLDILKSFKIWKWDPPQDLNANIFPSTLIKINLKWTTLTPHYWNALQNLPNLKILKLRGKESIDPNLTCKTGSFPQLMFFQIGFDSIESFDFAPGALASLQYLIVENCTLLATLPDQLWLSQTLRRVTVQSPCKAFNMYIDELDEDRRHKVLVIS